MERNFERNLEKRIYNVLDSSGYMNDESLDKIEVLSPNDFESRYGVKFYFKPNVPRSEQENILDNVWKQIYDYLDYAVYTVIHRNENIFESSVRVSEIYSTEGHSDKKIVPIIEKLLSDINIKGVCGFWIDDSFEDERIWVYIVIDLNWLNTKSQFPQMIAHRLRNDVKTEIKKWTGIDVSVGSTARAC